MNKMATIALRACLMWRKVSTMLLAVLLFDLFGCDVKSDDESLGGSSSNRASVETEGQTEVNTYESDVRMIDTVETASNLGDERPAQPPQSTTSQILGQSSYPSSKTVVTTEYGAIEGGVSDDGSYLYWLGVPYAAPPTDTPNHKRRWRAPQDPETWSDTLPTRQFKNHCVQLGLLYELTMDVDGSEDCLYLNVWRPNTDETSLPVFFWIHGGGYQFEDASMGAYNGATFAVSQNVIVVTLDYRLGYLGWLYHKALHTSGTTDEDRSGNFALLDVIKALDWVHENIQGFGGDSNNVTIAGQSAGGAFVTALLVSPMVGDASFRRVIMQSAPMAFGDTVGFKALSDAENAANTLIQNLLINNGTANSSLQAETLAGRMNEDEIEQLLRSTDAKTLVQLAWQRSAGIPIFPDTMFMDGYVLADTADTDFANDNYKNVPILTGTTAQEGKSFAIFMMADNEDALSYLREGFDPNSTNNKPVNELMTFPQQLMQAIISPLATIIFQMSEASLLAQISKKHDTDIFVYRFEYNNAPAPMDALYASGHMSELPFTWGNIRASSALENLYAYCLDSDSTLNERTDLSQKMMNYWGSFIRTGNPNDPSRFSQPTWNSYSSTRLLKRLHLGNAIFMMP